MVYVECYALQFWMDFLPKFDIFVIFCWIVLAKPFGLFYVTDVIITFRLQPLDVIGRCYCHVVVYG